jgi:hypothetical protein
MEKDKSAKIIMKKKKTSKKKEKKERPLKEEALKEEALKEEIENNLYTIWSAILSNKITLLDKSIRKTIRTMVINVNLYLLRKTNIPDKLLGFMIKSVHFHTPGFFFVLYCLLPIKLAVLALIPLTICLLMFFYFDGCYLTILEYKFLKEDINIIDPIIYLMNDKVTPKTRYYYTIAATITYFTIVTLILYVRYKYKL